MPQLLGPGHRLVDARHSLIRITEHAQVPSQMAQARYHAVAAVVLMDSVTVLLRIV
jgi:hypothetical protein